MPCASWQVLALVERRNERIVAIVEGKLGLGKARKVSARKVFDERAWCDGSRDARRLPTSRELCA